MVAYSPTSPVIFNYKGKGKFHPITAHEGPEGEQIYSSTLSSTSTIYVGA
jgi:hypothetical protein